MALFCPTLIAAVGDISHPNLRGSSLGVYRFWREQKRMSKALNRMIYLAYNASTPIDPRVRAVDGKCIGARVRKPVEPALGRKTRTRDGRNRAAWSKVCRSFSF